LAGVTCSIQDLMKDNIEIRIKNMEYLWLLNAKNQIKRVLFI
jgi:hypothetical protein